MPIAANALNISQKGVVMFDSTSIFTQGANPLFFNISMAYSAGTFTVQGSNGTALSATNPGYVTLQNPATPGQLSTILVTANQTFTDGTSGTIAGMKFGLPYGGTDVSWGANNMPLFLYAVVKSDATAIAFMVSRNPCARVAPAAAGIGQSGAVVNVSQTDMFSLAAITTSNYAGQPALYLGCFQARYTAGSPSFYTIQTLTLGIDGMGLNYNSHNFTMPTGTNGAATGKYFLDNGGTAPSWTTQGYNYIVNSDGNVQMGMSGTTTSVSGTGAVAAEIVLPYLTANQDNPSIGLLVANSLGGVLFGLTGLAPSNQIFYQMFINGNSITLNTAFVNTFANTITANIKYMAYSP